MAGYIYPNKHEARKAKMHGEVIVKVSGGYMLLTWQYYKVWRRNHE